MKLKEIGLNINNINFSDKIEDSMKHWWRDDDEGKKKRFIKFEKKIYKMIKKKKIKAYFIKYVSKITPEEAEQFKKELRDHKISISLFLSLGRMEKHEIKNTKEKNEDFLFNKSLELCEVFSMEKESLGEDTELNFYQNEDNYEIIRYTEGRPFQLKEFFYDLYNKSLDF